MALAAANGDHKRTQRSDAEALSLLRSVLDEQDLSQFFLTIKNQLRVTRLSHFDYVKSRDLVAIGMPKPAARRLLNAVRKRRFDTKFEKLANFIFPSRNSRANSNSFAASGSVARGNLPNSGYGQASLTGGDNIPSAFHALPTRQHGSPDPHVSCLINPASVKKGPLLGQGTFGEVFRAEWTPRDGQIIPVALKFLKPISSLTNATDALADEFLREVGVMQDLHHKNLIRLYGVCLREPKMIVTELAQTTLLDRLRKSCRQVDVNDLLRWAVQICDGMTYLEQRRFVHRDLAARNCLLKDNVIKIGDFGLMKHLSNESDYYIMNAAHKVAFAWCAPESLRRRQFSNKTDVFSYGVTLFEIFSFGEEPWATFSGAQILQLIEREGKRLPKPLACSRTIFKDIMLKCWMLRPEDRPPFADLSKFLPKLFDEHWHFQALHRFAWKEMLRQHAAANLTNSAKVSFEQITGLDFEAGDTISVTDFDAGKAFCKGQNLRTLDIGYFPRAMVPFKSSSKFGPQISHPVKNSFVHTGHGDGFDRTKWFGTPENIDELYLKNPVLPSPDADLLDILSSPYHNNNRSDLAHLAVLKLIGTSTAAGNSNRWQNQFPGLVDEIVQFSAAAVVPSTPATQMYNSFSNNVSVPSSQNQQQKQNSVAPSYANAGFAVEQAAFQPSPVSVSPVYPSSNSSLAATGQDLLKFEDEFILEKYDQCYSIKNDRVATEPNQTCLLDQTLSTTDIYIPQKTKPAAYAPVPNRPVSAAGMQYANFATIQNGAADLKYTPPPKYYNLIGFDPNGGFFDSLRVKDDRNSAVSLVSVENGHSGMERCSSLTQLNSEISNNVEDQYISRTSPVDAVATANTPAAKASTPAHPISIPASRSVEAVANSLSATAKPTSILEDLLQRVIAAMPQNEPSPLNVERARDALKRSHFSVEAAVLLIKAEKLHRIFSSLSIEQCRQSLAENDNDVDRAASILIDRLPR